MITYDDELLIEDAHQKLLNSGAAPGQLDLSESPATAAAVMMSADPQKNIKAFEDMSRLDQVINSLEGGYHNLLKSSAMSDALEATESAHLGLSQFSGEADSYDEEANEAVRKILEKDTSANRQFKKRELDRAMDAVREYRNLVAKDFNFVQPKEVLELSEEVKDMGLLEGLWHGAKKLTTGGNALSNAIYLTGSSFGAITPYLVMSAVGGQFTGSLLGGAKSAQAASLAVRSLIAGAGSRNVEIGSYIEEKMRESGYNTSDIESFKKLVANSAELEDLKFKANARGTTVGLFDAIAAGLAPVRMAPGDTIRTLQKACSLRKASGLKGAGAFMDALSDVRSGAARVSETRLGKVSGGFENLATQAVVQGTLGGAGEAFGSMAAGEKVNAADVLYEVLGEFTSAPADVITHSVSEVYDYRKDTVRAAESKKFAEKAAEMTRAAEAIANTLQDKETVDAWANRLGQDKVVFAFGQDVIESGAIEEIRKVDAKLAESIEKAAESGQSVSIPVAKITKIATQNRELANTILSDSRVSVDAMSPREAERFEKEGRAEAIRQFDRSIKMSKATQQDIEDAREAVADLTRQLVDAGVSERVAEMMTKPWEAKLINTARMLQISPKDLMARLHFRVVNGRITVSERVQEETGPTDSLGQVRTKEAPKKTRKVYKLMRIKVDANGNVERDANGNPNLYPLYIDSGKPISIGTWYDADSPDFTSLENLGQGDWLVNPKTGEAVSYADYATNVGIKKPSAKGQAGKGDIAYATQNGLRWMRIVDTPEGVKTTTAMKRYGVAKRFYNLGINGGKGGGAVTPYALRPGWHAGTAPSMTQVGNGPKGDIRGDDQVWVECEVPADIDYDSSEYDSYKTPDGDMIRMPTDGVYTYATNPIKAGFGIDWVIAGALKPNRIMSDAEAAAEVQRQNAEETHLDPETGLQRQKDIFPDYKRAGGRTFNAETMKLDEPEGFGQSARVNIFSNPDSKKFLSKAERDIISAADISPEMKVSVVDDIIKAKKENQKEDGWQPLVLSKVSVKDGKCIIEYEKNAYSFDRTSDGKSLKPGTAAYTRRVNAIASMLVDEVRKIYKRYLEGDKGAIEILKQAGWYANMRDRLRAEFGSAGDLLADLLGATSPNTPVKDNWENAADILKHVTTGQWNHLIPMWEAWDKNRNEALSRLLAFVIQKADEGLTKKEITALPEYTKLLNERKNAAKLPDELLPRKDNGSKYGFNSGNAVRAILNHWREVKDADPMLAIGSTAPKAITFSGNLIGYQTRATIDVWAARLLQRLAGKPRIPSRAETGLTGNLLESGKTTGQFGMGQDIMHLAAETIRNDEELKKHKTLAKVRDDDLQAVAWFIEKEIWSSNGWTSAEGAGGSFEYEADLEGNPDRIGIKQARSVLNRKTTTPEQKKAAAEFLKKAKDRATRWEGGLSMQQSEWTQGIDHIPTDDEQSQGQQRLRLAAIESVNGRDVISVNANSTFGVYGEDKKRSFNIEVTSRTGYNPDKLFKEMVKIAKETNQDSCFISRVLKEGEVLDFNVHRPGVEIYFRESKSFDDENLQSLLSKLKENGVTNYTVITDAKVSRSSLSGAMPDVVGVRFQLVPEFDERYGGTALGDKKWSELSEEEIASVIEQKSDEFNDIADKCIDIDGVTSAKRMWYATTVVFNSEYSEVLNDGVHTEGSFGAPVQKISGERKGPEEQVDAEHSAGNRPVGETGESQRSGEEQGSRRQGTLGVSDVWTAHLKDGSSIKSGLERTAAYVATGGVKNVQNEDQYIEPESFGQSGKEIPQSYVDAQNKKFMDNFDDAENSLGQVAHHGSPFRFDKFTLDNIGEGEGAQAHGWGLYFALDREISDEYRLRLSMLKYGTNVREYYDQKKFSGLTMSQWYSNIDRAATKDSKLYNRLQILEELMIRYDPLAAIESARESGLPESDIRWFENTFAKKWSVSSKAWREKTGALYTVEIPEDNVMLREEAKLSEQPEDVRKALEELAKLSAALDAYESSAADGGLLDGITEDSNGSQIYERLVTALGSPKEASLALASVGIKGIRYNGGWDGECAVVFDDQSVNIIGMYQSKSPREDRRGQYIPGNTSTDSNGYSGIINLLEHADKSTFMHESAHAWLDLDTLLAMSIADKVARGEEPTAGEIEFLKTLGGFWAWGQSEGVVDLCVDGSIESILSAAQKWSSLSLAEQRGMHELFAEGFESYMMTGEAPNAEMKTLFKRFASWLKEIYKTVTQKPHPISPEVKKLYDLLFISEQEAADAEVRAGMKRMFTEDDAVKLMTAEERRQYEEMNINANLEAEGIVRKSVSGIMRIYTRIRQATARKIQKDYKDRVEARIQQLLEEPRYYALDILTKGVKDPDGKKQKTKLNYQLMSNAGYDIETLSILSAKGFITDEADTKSGVSPAQLAAMCGVSDAEGLISELIDVQDVDIEATQQIAAEVQQETGETPEVHSQLQSDIAAHNETRTRLMTAEYNAIARLVCDKPMMADAAREYAINKVNGIPVKNLMPYRYINDEKRCARLAEKAFREGDYQACLRYKRGQIVNAEMARAALEAKKKYESIVRRIRRALKSNAIYPPYKRLLVALSTKHNVQKLSQKQREKIDMADVNREIAASIAQLKEEGTPIDGIDEFVVDEEAMRSMTVERMTEFADILLSLETVGRNRVKQNLVAEEERVGGIVEAAKLALFGAAESQGRTPEYHQTVSKTPFGKVKEQIARIACHHIKIATWCRIFDRNKDNGFFWNLFIRTANARSDFEVTHRHVAATKLREILKPIFPNGRAFKSDVVSIGRVGKMSKGERFAAALNCGNQSNLERLFSGDPRWDEEALSDLYESLTTEEWNAVQKIWYLFESYRPLIAEKEKRVFGVEPKWIDVTKFDVLTKDGDHITLRGGYYPVVYDPKASTRSEMYEDAADVQQEMRGAYQSATTRRSFTKERSKNAPQRALRLDMTAMYRGLNDIIHDLAWHEWLIETKKVLDGVSGIDSGIRKDIHDLYGANVAKEFEDWRRDIAQGDRAAFDCSLWRAMSGAVGMSTMGFSFSSAVMQLTGLGYAIPRVGAKNFLSALKHFASSPVKLRTDINEKSEYMRNRALTMNKSIADIMLEIESNPNGPKAFIAKWGYSMLMAVQSLVDTVTWRASFEKAMREGIASEEDCIAIADQDVRDTQSSGEISSLSSVERNELLKPLTIFYSWANTALNQSYAEFKGESDRRKAYSRLFMMGAVMPIIDTIIRDALKADVNGDGDDDDDSLNKLWRIPVGAIFEYHLGLFLVTREVASAVGNAVKGEKVYGYSGPAGTRQAAAVTNVASAFEGVITSGPTWKMVQSLIDLAGTLTGTPSSQVKKTIKGARAIANDKVEPLQYPQALMFGVDGRVD